MDHFHPFSMAMLNNQRVVLKLVAVLAAALSQANIAITFLSQTGQFGGVAMPRVHAHASKRTSTLSFLLLIGMCILCQYGRSP